MRYHGILWMLVFVFASSTSDSVSAAGVLFNVDSNASEITLSGTVAGITLREQGPGGLTTHFEGRVFANLNRTTIAFPGSSALDALTNGVWRPLPGGSDEPSTGAPADYGAQGSVLFGTARAAVRDLVLDLIADQLPLNNGTFDASRLVFAIPDGASAAIDFNAGFLGSGRQPLSGFSTNRVASTASLATDGELQRMTIPIDAEYRLSVLAENDSVVQLRGQLVATRPFLPLIHSISIDDGVVTVQADGLPNRTYQLQRSTDLQNWTSTPGSDADPDPAEYEFSTPVSGTIEFFRLGTAAQ